MAEPKKEEFKVSTSKSVIEEEPVIYTERERADQIIQERLQLGIYTEDLEMRYWFLLYAIVKYYRKIIMILSKERMSEKEKIYITQIMNSGKSEVDNIIERANKEKEYIPSLRLLVEGLEMFLMSEGWIMSKDKSETVGQEQFNKILSYSKGTWLYGEPKIKEIGRMMYERMRGNMAARQATLIQFLDSTYIDLNLGSKEVEKQRLRQEERKTQEVKEQPRRVFEPSKPTGPIPLIPPRPVTEVKGTPVQSQPQSLNQSLNLEENQFMNRQRDFYYPNPGIIPYPGMIIESSGGRRLIQQGLPPVSLQPNIMIQYGLPPTMNPQVIYPGPTVRYPYYCQYPPRSGVPVGPIPHQPPQSVGINPSRVGQPKLVVGLESNPMIIENDDDSTIVEEVPVEEKKEKRRRSSTKSLGARKAERERDLERIRNLSHKQDDVVNVNLNQPKTGNGLQPERRRSALKPAKPSRVRQENTFWSMIYLLCKYEGMTFRLQVGKVDRKKDVREIIAIEGPEIPVDIKQTLLQNEEELTDRRRNLVINSLVELLEFFGWKITSKRLKEKEEGEGMRRLVTNVKKEEHEFNVKDFRKLSDTIINRLYIFLREGFYIFAPSNILHIDERIRVFELKVEEKRKEQEEGFESETLSDDSDTIDQYLK